MNPMKYRKAVWTKVEPEDKSAAAIQVERMEQYHARKAKINAFMDDLKQLSDKHGIRLSHNFGDGDVCLFDGGECLSDNVDLDSFTAYAYEPPIPHVRPEGYKSNLNMSAMEKFLSKEYKEAIMKQLVEPSIFEELLTRNEPSPIFKRFEKGNGQ